jgi:excisionase family DNA binding protein
MAGRRFEGVPRKSQLSDLMSIADAARLRGVTHGAIRDLIGRGRLSTLEIGGRRFVSRSEVETFEPSKGGRPVMKKGGKK